MVIMSELRTKLNINSGLSRVVKHTSVVLFLVVDRSPSILGCKTKPVRDPVTVLRWNYKICITGMPTPFPKGNTGN